MTGPDLSIRPVGPDDVPALIAALRALARDLGDPFRATEGQLADALFGPQRYAFALLAVQGEEVLGTVMCHPVFSTMQGSAFTFVSDLWVAADARGRSLGRKLLHAAAREGAVRWGSGALRLTVYAENDDATAFYRRLGFEIRERDRAAVLAGPALAGLLGEPA